jgi:hypothetical protein
MAPSVSSSKNIFSGKSPVQAWRIVRREILKRGPSAFGHRGYSVSYSGPDKVVSPENDPYIPFPPRLSNLDRSKSIIEELKAISAVWLDDSQIGRFLFVENDLYAALKVFFTENGDEQDRRYRKAADYVMSRVSRAYIKSAFGYAATAVCGAGHKRIFYRYEMPVLVKNKKVTAINGLPRKMVEEFYAIGRDEAFQLICLAEMIQSKRRLDRDDSRENRQDYEQRLYFFEKERKAFSAKNKTLPDRWNQKREEKRATIMKKYADELAKAGLGDILNKPTKITRLLVSLPQHAAYRAILA